MIPKCIPLQTYGAVITYHQMHYNSHTLQCWPYRRTDTNRNIFDTQYDNMINEIMDQEIKQLKWSELLRKNWETIPSCIAWLFLINCPLYSLESCEIALDERLRRLVLNFKSFKWKLKRTIPEWDRLIIHIILCGPLF